MIVDRDIGAVKFSHYGIALYESEIIYSTLMGHFETVEELKLQVDDNQYASLVQIEFPCPYGESFFQVFTIESWFKIKGILKEMKRRRGRKGLKAFISFNGINSKIKSNLIFSISNKDNRHFEMGIEKIEYLVDIVPMQLNVLPTNIEEIYYNYDDSSLKWSPSIAKKTDGLLYFFKDNKWLVQ
jgi:hypothetical protein